MGKLFELIVEEIAVEGYERVVEIKDEASGLHAIIALHDTTLGPALGGIRVYPYSSFEAALDDVLRLSKGMTYKAAIAGTGTGGGKSVIIADYRKPKSEELLLAFAEAINLFEGLYIGAEDLGMPAHDLEVIRQGTPYLVGLPHPQSSGDPGRFTAFGGFLGAKAAAKKLWGSDSLKGKTIAIQGLGSVGMRLADSLFWQGAKLIVTDINPTACEHAARQYAATVVSPEAIYGAECDLFAPCALGGILNPQTIPQLRCQAIAGLANNQLLTEADGYALMERGILYSPDYVINGGGLLNVCVELYPEGYNPDVAREQIELIYDHLLTIYALSEEKEIPTNIVANQIAEHNVAHGIGKRQEPVIFHH